MNVNQVLYRSLSSPGLRRNSKASLELISLHCVIFLRRGNQLLYIGEYQLRKEKTALGGGVGNYRMHVRSSSDTVVLLTMHIVSSVLNCTRFKLNGLFGAWLVDRYWLIPTSMFIIEHATFKDYCPSTN